MKGHRGLRRLLEQRGGHEGLHRRRLPQSGDLGALLPTGHLKITGRKKEIIVTAGGRDVSPGPLEDILRSRR